nr:MULTISPECIES: hypothetical protein [unclassified Rhodococcus (in: high G+C Gram-positive bacteria)]
MKQLEPDPEAILRSNSNVVTNNTFHNYERGRAVHGPADVGPEYGQLIAALRTLQDLAVSTAPTAEATAEAINRVEALNVLLRPFRVPAAQSPAGKVAALPGRGSLLHLPWTIEKFDADGVRGRGVFRRFHHGSNGAAHGGHYQCSSMICSV